MENRSSRECRRPGQRPLGQDRDGAPAARREEQWGLFTGTFAPAEPGEHRLVMTCAENGGTLETKITVQGTARERIGEPARHDVLEEIARITRGELIASPDPAVLRERLAALPEPNPSSAASASGAPRLDRCDRADPDPLLGGRKMAGAV